MNTFSHNLRALLTLVCALGLMTGLFACDNVGNDVTEDDPLQFPRDRSVVETIQNETSLNTLKVAADTAGLISELSGEGPYTIFATPNQSFDPVALDSLLGDRATLRGVLRYHVVSGQELTAEDLSDGQELSTTRDDGANLSINKVQVGDGTRTFVNGAQVTSTTDVENGVVHTLDRVIFPTIAQQLRYTTRLQSLSRAVEAAGLRSQLNDIQADEVTLFAPSNTALSMLGGGGGAGVDSLLSNQDLLGRVLQYHVATEETSENTSDGSELPTLLESDFSNAPSLGVSVDDASIEAVNGVGVTESNYETANGVLHVTAQVLKGGMTITERAQFSSDLTSLAGALQAGGLASQFNNQTGGPYTIFAPTNGAFAGVNAGILTSQPDLTERVLSYHALDGRTFTSGISAGGSATTLQGVDVSFGFNDEDVLLVNGTPVPTTDLKTLNGVVHLLDGVLLRPTTAAEFLQVAPQTNNPDPSVTADLYSVVEAAGLAGALDDQSATLTLLAPITEALAEDQISELDSTSLAQKVLRTHFLTGQALLPSEISGQQTFTAENGVQLAVSRDENDNLTVGDIAVVNSQQVSNGVVNLYNGLQLQGTNVMERVILTPQFSTLQSILQDSSDAAGLAGTLSGSGPYTLFAPTNAAIAAEENPGEIAGDLEYHVLEQELMTADVTTDTTSRTTLQGESVFVTTTNDTTFVTNDPEFVNGNALLMPDLNVQNGVVHGLGGVLTPPAQGTAAATRQRW